MSLEDIQGSCVWTNEEYHVIFLYHSQHFIIEFTVAISWGCAIGESSNGVVRLVWISISGWEQYITGLSDVFLWVGTCVCMHHGCMCWLFSLILMCCSGSLTYSHGHIFLSMHCFCSHLATTPSFICSHMVVHMCHQCIHTHHTTSHTLMLQACITNSLTQQGTEFGLGNPTLVHLIYENAPVLYYALVLKVPYNSHKPYGGCNGIYLFQVTALPIHFYLL